MKINKYTVTVEAEVVETAIIGKRWEKGGPIERSESSEYGYTPEVESTVTKKIDIYTQTVETLDMASLVRVVNGIA